LPHGRLMVAAALIKNGLGAIGGRGLRARGER
jgi:hypothetical protein